MPIDLNGLVNAAVTSAIADALAEDAIVDEQRVAQIRTDAEANLQAALAADVELDDRVLERVNAEAAIRLQAALAPDALAGAATLAAKDFVIGARNATTKALRASIAQVSAVPTPTPKPSQLAFPGPTNTGYENAPGYPGSLTVFKGAPVANTTYSFMDFVGSVGIEVAGCTFIGCRFQSNSTGYFNVEVPEHANDTTFKYCSFTPLVSKVAAPTHDTWPSAGAGQPVDGDTGYSQYMIGGNDGYQFALNMYGSNQILENCDIWGFGNAIVCYGTGTKVIKDCWIHDAANPNPQGYHTDGIGYLSGTGAGCSNVTIDHCTIASLGNTNAIAFQQASSGYNNIIVKDCYFSGFGYCVDMLHGNSFSENCQFINNTFGTDVRWTWGPVGYAGAGGAPFNKRSNIWRGNKIKVVPGTSKGTKASLAFTQADDGKFVMPNGALSTRDFE